MLSPNITLARDSLSELINAADRFGARGFRAVTVRRERRGWTADLLHEPGATFAHFTIRKGAELKLSRVVAVEL